jgi:hypothetical protein
VLKLWDGTRKSDKLLIIHLNLHLSRTPLALGQAIGDSGLIRLTTTWIKKATTFPHIIFSAPLHNTYIRMAFYPGTPKEVS